MRSNQLSYLAIILLSYQDCHYTIAQLESERKGRQILENSKKKIEFIL